MKGVVKVRGVFAHSLPVGLAQRWDADLLGHELICPFQTATNGAFCMRILPGEQQPPRRLEVAGVPVHVLEHCELSFHETFLPSPANGRRLRVSDLVACEGRDDFRLQPASLTAICQDSHAGFTSNWSPTGSKRPCQRWTRSIEPNVPTSTQRRRQIGLPSTWPPSSAAAWRRSTPASVQRSEPGSRVR